MSTEGHAVSRRTLLRGAGLLGLGGLLSGCGSAFASGVAGTGPPGNTLSYWNLFGSGDGYHHVLGSVPQALERHAHYSVIVIA